MRIQKLIQSYFSKPPEGDVKKIFIKTNELVDAINDFQEGNIDNDYFVFVNTINDLPEPVGGVITLADNVTYFITSTIDLLGDRLVCGQNTTILGGSSENCRIKSTGLTDALITSNYSLPIRNITIEANLALDLDATGNSNQALDWFGVNFTDCAVIGTVKSYSNFIATDCAVLNSANWTFDGTIGTIGFTQTIFDGRSGQTTIVFPSTLTVTRRIKFNRY
jgi:hypothetical protein